MSDRVIPHATLAERVARGRAARSAAPRRSQSVLQPRPDRDPVAQLAAESATRVAELLPIRYGRMLRSPLAFLRGAAGIMADDLAGTARAGLDVQLCGDAHLLNFGGFASPERQLVFDVVDFDETLRGPFEWDVKRLAASVEVAARERGIADRERDRAVLGTIRAYREAMRELAGRGDLDAWYARADAELLLAELRREHDPTGVETLEREAERAQTHDNVHALAKLTRLVDGEPRIVSRPPLIVPLAELAEEGDALEATLRAAFRSYGRTLQGDRRRLLEGFRYADLARKVVGIGSVGTRCWILLLLGRDAQDPLFLQLKEAQASILEPLLATSRFANRGQRIVEGQRLCQAVSDIFLGWTRVQELDGEPRDFYVRQLRDWRISIDLDRTRPRGLAAYVSWCGAALARAHARSGDRVAIATYLGGGDSFDRAVAAFASAYAELTERDHASFRRAVRDGRLPATEGV
jgi:uncharacterized protein (DUF2252 family)